MATRKKRSSKSSPAGEGGAPPPVVSQVAFRLTTNADEGYKVTLHHPSTGYPRAICRDKELHVRSADSAADLIDNLNAAAALAEQNDARDAQSDDDGSQWEYVEQLHKRLQVALPSWHPVALLAANVLAEYTDAHRPPRERAEQVVAAFDALPDDGKRRVFNGWHVPTKRRPSSQLYAGKVDFLTYRVLEFETGGGDASAHWSFRNDDSAGVHPVRLLVTEGTSKADVLNTLRKLTELVAAGWEPIVTHPHEHEPIPAVRAFFNGTFYRDFTDRDTRALERFSAIKSGTSPKPHVPELGGQRNAKAHKTMPAA